MTEHQWSEDKLNRKQDADILLRFIEGKLEQRSIAGLPRSYVVNLDSQWGSGKTFFLTNLKEQISSRGQVAVYVDAWKDDHSDDPFVAVVSAIESELRSVLQDNDAGAKLMKIVDPVARSTLRVLGTSVKSGVIHFAKKQIGQEAIEQLGELFEGEEDDIEKNKASILKATNKAVDTAGTALSSGFAAAKDARATFRKNLAILTEELAKLEAVDVPVFVLIDELDRCRPSYAVELLEEVKHLFYVQNMVFILGTDTEQLAFAVNGVYGAGFDGRRYLSRFIDRTYRFRKSEVTGFVEHCMAMNGLKEEAFAIPKELGVKGFLAKAFEHADVSLRYIEQIMDYIATFAATWEHQGLGINLVLLLELAVDAHPDSVRSLNGPYKIMETNFDFLRYDARSPSHRSNYSVENMKSILLELSKDVRKPPPPIDDFRAWARHTVNEEIKVFRDLRPGRVDEHTKGIAEEYPRMFNEMLGLHSAISGD